MHKFVRNLLTEWRKLGLPVAGETIIVAVSGGADSVSLALALHELKERKKLDLRFIVAHFNHGLRGAESDQDAEFVQALAEKSDLEFISETQNPHSPIRAQKGNLEQNARRARYDFLFRAAESYGASAILTAHTRNDQAETLLLNLIRGSGLDGLAGMKAVQNVELRPDNVSEPEEEAESRKPKAKIVRPMLNWAERTDTEDFCAEKRVDACADRMNDDRRYSRVRVRHEIIPLLQKINPRVIETLSGTARILREDVEELGRAQPELPVRISQKELELVSKSMRRRALREWLRRRRGHLRQIELKHIEAVERLTTSTKSGRIIELPGGGRVIKRDGKIVFEKSRVEKSRGDY